MLKIGLTPKLAGLEILGDCQDLQRLHDAMVHIIGSETAHGEGYIMTAARLLDVAHELRMTSMGQRLACFFDNGVTDPVRQKHKILAPGKNIAFACRFLMPEALFAIMSISDFIERYNLDRKSGLPDRDVLVLELFQAEAINSLNALCEDGAARRLVLEIMGTVPRFENFYTQYIDLLCQSYLKLEPDDRRQQVMTLARSFNSPGIDYSQMVMDLEETASRMHCGIADLEPVSEVPDLTDQDW